MASRKSSSSSGGNWIRMCAFSSLSLLILLLPFGSAIKCYQCQSKSDPACGEENLPANPPASHPAAKFLVDCNTNGDKSNAEPSAKNNNFTFCRKQVQDVDDKKNIIRACGLVKGDKDCYSTANPPTKTLVCQCFTDGCNSASGLSINMAVLILSVAGILKSIRVF